MLYQIPQQSVHDSIVYSLPLGVINTLATFKRKEIMLYDSVTSAVMLTIVCQ